MVSSAAEDGAGASCSGDGGGVQGSSAAAAEVEVSSHPDSLKNTPSNIARLEYVIEQCEGREKYRAKTKSPSDGEDFRWYFCKVPLAEDELAASVPRTEIVGKGEYFRFCMRDSLALEAAFLHKEEELLTYWWREYAECSEGPSGPSGNSTANKQLVLRSSKSEEATSTHAVDEERVGVPIKGGLYEVDLERRHCFPVYWNGENRRVLRGHWFARKNGLDQLPIREDVAEQLEYAYRGQVWHRRTFQLSGLFAARVDLQGSTQGLHALFTGEDDTWEAQLGVDNSGFPQVTGQGLNGIKLSRGFSLSGSAKPTQDELRQQKEEEIDDYCSQVPVRHLVFMVHGIGQRLEKSNLVDDVGDFRHLTASLAERHLTSYQLVTQRILFIPCQWRRGLKLTGESAVEKCTLDGVRGLRVMLGATVHDILYYMSPIYCQDIINSVSNQLNRLYMKFMMRNPSYDGKVSIYAHSLGSVLSYDILCHQANLSSPLPLDCMYSKCGQVEGSEVDPAYESGESNSFMGTKEKDSNENAGDCVEGDILSTSHYNIVASVEQDVKHLSLSGASSSSTSSLKEFSGHHQHLSEPHASSTECSDSSQLTDAILSPRGVLNSYPLLCEDGNDLTVDINVGVPASDHSGDTLTCDMLENVEDKDKIIFNMREEVNFLKAKIAELEARNNSSAFLKRDGEVGDNCQQGVVERCPSKENAMDHHDPRKSHTPYITYTKLKFEVDTFFAVGSPLAVFLALRNIRIGIGKGQEYRQDEKITEEMPACHQMFNIFHPFDPVAYRVEPLVCKEYISKRPVIIPYHKGGKRLHIGFQEFTEDLALRSKEFVNQLNFVKVKMVSVFLKNKDKLQDATENAQSVDERTYGSLMMQRLTGSEDGRIDYVLQNKTFQHPYISAIGSHTNYWRDPDTALFILNHLYRDIPEEPDSPDFVGGLKNVEKKIGLIYQTDPMDEDLPLTFSDNSLIRAFSRKARRSMKKS